MDGPQQKERPFPVKRLSSDESNDPIQKPVINKPEDRPAPNAFVAFSRKVYRPLGFNKGYNFPLWFIFAGAMFGFVLARFQYLSVGGIFAANASPGEWYWYRQGHYRVGITIHLATVLPAGLLMVFQFVPVIRHKAILFHRLNGYAIVILTLIGNAGALMIVRRSFGGTLPTQAGVGLLVILTTLGLTMAIYNIKKLQIEQHRAWMLRTMFWLGSIITLRIIMIISVIIVTIIQSYYSEMPCSEIQFLDGKATAQAVYPQCFLPNGQGTTDGWVAVKGNFNGLASQVGAAFDISFGTAMWIAIVLHTVGVEIYLKLTPAETERLRNVSYQRQMEAGFANPGSAGLVVERFGDAPAWTPKVV